MNRIWNKYDIFVKVTIFQPHKIDLKIDNIRGVKQIGDSSYVLRGGQLTLDVVLIDKF